MAKSHASSVHLAGDTPNSLDNREGISERFSAAQHENPRDDLMADYADQTEQGDREAEMVKDDALKHDMRPPPEIAAEQDRETFNARWDAEQQSARDDLISDYANQVSHEREKDQDWELGI